MTAFRDKTCWVVGLARSGCAAGGLLRRHGAHVVGVDDAAEDEVRARWDRDSLTMDAAAAFHDLSVGGAPPEGRPDFVVISPGVPGDHRLLISLAKNVPVIGELELGARFCRAETAAITGTNGKTTTTELVAHLGRMAGRKAHALGNVGRPFCDVADSLEPEDLAILEVSSFQLESVDRFSPRVGAVLNLAPDHLDRYADLGSYYAAKRVLADNTDPSGTFVTWTGCPEAMDWPTAATSLLFGDEDKGAGVFFRGDELVCGGQPLLAREDLALQSPPNLLNALAATAIASALDLDRTALAEGLRSFTGLAHRHEPVARKGGVVFINDTKATNVHAVCSGLDGYRGEVVLIVGGSGKGEDYTPLRDVMGAVRAVILIGEEGPAIGAMLEGLVPMKRAVTMDEAVAEAAELAQPDAAVLLSPACASFDMFHNYEQRGAAFTAAALSVGAERIPAVTPEGSS